MQSAESDPTNSSAREPAKDTATAFEFAHADLRRALIQAIARRAGKYVEPVSIQEAYSDISLEELYRRKLHANRLTEVIDRLLFRWWRPQ